MGKAILGVRVVLGVIFVLFGLNYFIPFFATPANPEPAQALLGAFFSAGYLFPLIKLTELIAGSLLLIGFVPLGLILLAPVVVNILAFHIFLAPGGLGLSVLILLLMGFLAWAYRDRFAPLFKK